MHGFSSWQTGVISICARVERETRAVSHVDNPLTCAKPPTLDSFRIHIAKLVVIKRGEAINLGKLVVCLGSECFSFQESGRKGFAVRPTSKYLDECLDLVQLQNGKHLVTLLADRRVRICMRDKCMRSNPRCVLQSNCWKATVHYMCPTRSLVRNENSVLQTCNTCRFDRDT